MLGRKKKKEAEDEKEEFKPHQTFQALKDDIEKHPDDVKHLAASLVKALDTILEHLPADEEEDEEE